MNLLLVGTVIFVIVYLFLNWFAKTSSKAIAQKSRKIILILSLILAVLLAYAGRFLFSLPLLLIFLKGLKIKGLTTFQIFQLWRLIQYLRSTGKFSYGAGAPSANQTISLDESYKILGLKKGVTKKMFSKPPISFKKKFILI